ncbi:hypothetical protein MAH1_27450 [Sessilibacter sp. MAH1]
MNLREHINQNIWYARWIGFSATFIGIGISRMSFTPLAATAVELDIFPKEATTVIGALLMLGYATGAIIAGPMIKRIGILPSIRVCFVIGLICQIVELIDLTVSTWQVTRFMYNVIGGALMVTGPVLAVSKGSDQQKSKTPLWSFVGIGIGAMVSASFMLLPLDLFQQQQLLTIVVFLVVGFNLFLLSYITYEQNVKASKAPLPKAAICVIIGYAMAAACFVPGSVYLSDYAANELLWGSKEGSTLWLFFGIGGLLSTPLLSRIYPKHLNGSALTVLFTAKLTALAIFAFYPNKMAFYIAALTSGFCLPNIVLLTSNWLRENLSQEQFSSAWQVATMCFSSGQAVSALILALIFDSSEIYQVLFVVALIFVAVGLSMVNMRFLFPINNHQKQVPPDGTMKSALN